MKGMTEAANLHTVVVEDDGAIWIKSLVVGSFNPEGLEAKLAVRLSRTVERAMAAIGAQRTLDGAMRIDKEKAEQALISEEP
jgi:hypothetical protein